MLQENGCYFTKNTNPKHDVFKNPRKKLIKKMDPIKGNFGNQQTDLLFLDKYNHNFGIFLALIEITSRFGIVYSLKKNLILIKLLKNLFKNISQL